MSYENPQVPHEVNVSREDPVVEFFRLLAGIGLCALGLSAVLYLCGGWLARLIPFSTERAWVGDKVIGIDIEESLAPEHSKIETYLQKLSDDLASKMELPRGMTLKVHYITLDVPNAFATLGGHIVVTSDLYRRMPSENALAMALGHEIGHIKARDPISALGGTASLAVVLALLSGQVDGLVPHLANIVQRGYSRRAESQADDIAIRALVAVYGHAGGGAAVFEVLKEYQEQAGMAVPSMLSTHPADADRISHLKSAAANWNEERDPLRPIVIPFTEPIATETNN